MAGTQARQPHAPRARARRRRRRQAGDRRRRQAALRHLLSRRLLSRSRPGTDLAQRLVCRVPGPLPRAEIETALRARSPGSLGLTTRAMPERSGAEMPFAPFDRSRLRVQPLSSRQHDLTLADVLALDAPPPAFAHPALPVLAERLVTARRNGRARILLLGAHVLRAGVVRFLIDLMERGLINHIALNGAGPIHDWEFALIGATTESVARYIQTGEFGLWEETGRINDAIRAGAESGIGMGEAIGGAIHDGGFPHKELSLLAAGVRLNVPVTVHVGIGYDIIHEHANCDGAALGRTSYQDFLIFTQSVTQLEGGVLLNFGSAVMGPEIYLKALAMARNVAHQKGREIRRFTTAVFDLVPLDADTRRQAPKTDPRYYYRPWKTILVRTVADGGESFYVQGDHRDTVPAIYHAMRAAEARAGN